MAMPDHILGYVILGGIGLYYFAKLCSKAPYSKTIVSDHAIDPYAQKNKKGRYTLHVVGEQYDGHQTIISQLKVGEKLILKRESDNQYDKNAVAVTTAHDNMVGYIPRKNAEWVARIIDEGFDLKTSVASLFDDGKGFTNVQIHIDGVPTINEEYGA
jgi:hypothetical protein